MWVSNISETLTEFELLEGEEEDPFLLEEGLQETIVLEDELLKIITPSLIKRSLQLNALEISGVVIQRRRFIRVGTLFTYIVRVCTI